MNKRHRNLICHTPADASCRVPNKGGYNRKWRIPLLTFAGLVDPARYLGGKPNWARSWSQSREWSSLPSRSAGGYSFFHEATEDHEAAGAASGHRGEGKRK